MTCLFKPVQNQGIIGYDHIILTAHLFPSSFQLYCLKKGRFKHNHVQSSFLSFALITYHNSRNLSYSTRFRMWYILQSFCLKVSPETTLLPDQVCLFGGHTLMTLSWKISTHSCILFPSLLSFFMFLIDNLYIFHCLYL